MPTSISHLGGRARVNEPGRYRKKNNKNLMAQGLPTYVGMPQPLRNLIAKRVKPSEAISKKKDSTVNYGKLAVTFTIQSNGSKNADLFWGTSKDAEVVQFDDSTWKAGFFTGSHNEDETDSYFVLRWDSPQTGTGTCNNDLFFYRINGNGSANNGVNPGLLPNTPYLITVFKDVDNMGTFNATTDANRTLYNAGGGGVISIPDSLSFIKSNQPPQSNISVAECPACSSGTCPDPTTGFPAWLGETIKIYVKKA